MSENQQCENCKLWKERYKAAEFVHWIFFETISEKCGCGAVEEVAENFFLQESHNDAPELQRAIRTLDEAADEARQGTKRSG